MGKGVAYSTSEPAHLLNVRAEGMSALAGDPDHFARMFEAQGGDRRGFAERRFFAQYLGGILDQAVSSGAIQLSAASAVHAVRAGHGWRVTLDDHSSITADALVLATGNQEPERLPAFAGTGKHFINDPWGAEARSAVDSLVAADEPVLLVGTGLTMVDLALSLDAASYQGRIVALSRRGLAPRGHADFAPAPVQQDELPSGLRPLLGWLRRRAAEVGWRAAIDSLRPHSHSLWQGLSGEEHRRFLRHARPWWDVHRHRIAPEVAATMTRMVADGRLEIVAGRILAAREISTGMEVDYRRRGSKEVRSETFGFVFNCTGPLHSITQSKDPLLRALLGEGAVQADHLGIGFRVDETNRAGDHLWAMGPLTKGRYWEITAVPDIREQAAQVANDIQRALCA